MDNKHIVTLMLAFSILLSAMAFRAGYESGKAEALQDLRLIESMDKLTEMLK